MAQANIKAVITADDRASATLRGFGNHVDGVGNKIKRTMKVVGLAATAAAGAAVAFGVSSVKSYTESEDALAQLNATLKSTKGVAGVTAKSAVNLANSLQKVTKYSDEEVLSAENLLLTFTKIGKDIFPQATNTVLDMSTALGQDLKSSSIQLGKALQDPILGITALRRVGVNFNDAQKEVIANLVKTGKHAEAQKLILKELQVEFGGSAKAAGETFAGKLKILQNQFDEVKESIGKTIVEGLTPLASKIAEFIASEKFQAWLKELNRWLAVNLPKAFNYLTTVLIPALVNIFNTLWPVIKVVLEWIGRLIKFMGDHTWMVWGLVSAFIALKAAMAISKAAALALAAMNLVGLGAVTNAGKVGKLRLALTLLSKHWVISLGIIGVATVIGAINQVIAAIDRTKTKINDLNATKVNVGGAEVSGGSGLGLVAQLRRALGGRAMGGPVTGNTPYIVGEKGPEIFTPNQSGNIIPNNKIGGGVTINITAGAFMGSEIDARRFANKILSSLKDTANSKGVSLAQMIGT